MLAASSTALTLTVAIYADDGFTPVTGLVAATFPPVKWTTPRGATQTQTLSDLASLTASHSAGGVKERSEGRYRLDAPDGITAVSGYPALWADATGKHMVIEAVGIVVAVDPNNAASFGLSRFDAEISSRLASGSYTAPPSAATNASQVRAELTTELGRINDKLNVSGTLAHTDNADLFKASAGATPQEIAEAVAEELTATGGMLATIKKLLQTLRSPPR